MEMPFHIIWCIAAVLHEFTLVFLFFTSMLLHHSMDFRLAHLEFENQLALGLGNSDSSSTLAQEVMLTHVCAQNFGHNYRLEEIEVVGFPNVS